MGFSRRSVTSVDSLELLLRVVARDEVHDVAADALTISENAGEGDNLLAGVLSKPLIQRRDVVYKFSILCVDPRVDVREVLHLGDRLRLACVAATTSQSDENNGYEHGSANEFFHGITPFKERV